MPPRIDGMIVGLPVVSRSQQFEGDLAIKALRQRLALQPEIISPPPIRRQRAQAMLPPLGRLSLVLLVASTVALTVVVLTLPDTRSILLGSGSSAVTAGRPQLASAPTTLQLSPRLIVGDRRRTFSNEALALGVLLSGATGTEVAVLRGLAPGTGLSVGSPVGETGWRLPARDLATAFAFAPRDFVGLMTIAIDLRMSNDRLVDSRLMQLEWQPRPPEQQIVARRTDRDQVRPEARPEAKALAAAESGPAATPETKAAPAVAPPVADAAEIAALVKRGQDFMQSGDIVSARLMLRRAASTGDAQASLLLGASFDPVVLRDLGVLGFAPDPAQARSWYERAADAGSPEAMRRLERLTKLAR